MKYFGSRISENMVKTPEGFLICLGVPIARTGVMDYTEEELEDTEVTGDDDGIVKVARDEDEVFKPSTIASFEGKPFTIRHPEALVNPESWSRLAKGHLKNVRRGEGEAKNDLLADIVITDAQAIYLVENDKMREVSCGYEADYKQTAPGKGKQSNIIGNHLALVEQGRAGSGYAINDHKGVKMDFKKIFAAFAKDPEAVKAMKAISLDAKTVTTDEEAAPSMDEKMGALMDKMDKVCDAVIKAGEMAQPAVAAKDKKAKDAEAAAAKEKVGDDDPMKKIMDAMGAIGKRLDALEGKTDDEDEVVDEESEEDVTSGDEEEGEETGDEDEGEETGDEEAPKVISGDSASRAEIIAPGLELEDGDKNFKVKALKHCHSTKDGKKIVEALNGGKKPVWTDKKTVDHLFVSVSEVLKAKRGKKNAKTKFADAELIDGTPDSQVITAEKMNEMNAKFYAKRGESTH